MLVEVEFEKPLDERTAKHLVYEAVLSFLGELGAARSGVQLKEWDEEKQNGVLKCKTSMLEETLAALAAKRFFEKKDVAIRLKKISGTIKGLNAGM